MPGKARFLLSTGTHRHWHQRVTRQMDLGFIFQLPWNPGPKLRNGGRRQNTRSCTLRKTASSKPHCASSSKAPSDGGIHANYPGLLGTRLLDKRYICLPASHELQIPTWRTCAISTPSTNCNPQKVLLPDIPTVESKSLLLLPTTLDTQFEIPEASSRDVGYGDLTSTFQEQRSELDECLASV